MNCPHYHSSQTTQLQRTTFLGSQMFRCQQCHRTFNERTATAFPSSLERMDEEKALLIEKRVIWETEF